MPPNTRIIIDNIEGKTNPDCWNFHGKGIIDVIGQKGTVIESDDAPEGWRNVRLDIEPATVFVFLQTELKEV